MGENRVRTLRSVVIFLLSVMMVLGNCGAVGICAEESSTEMKLTVDRCVLKPGQKLRIGVENAADAKITYSSRDAEIATVSRLGKITGISEGKTTVIVLVTPKTGKSTKFKCKVKIEAEKKVSLMAVGDALIHENILKSGKKSDGTYNYDALFANVTDYISGFDVKIINQETIFINDKNKFGGYPSFGTPTEVGDAMRKAGFNVITCATNHAYDRGAQGIKDTVKYWEKYKDSVLMTGIYTDQESYDTLSIGEYNGIKIAFLNYTTLLNSGAKREPYYLRYYKEATALKEIAAAKKQADFVVVLPHWGVEYEHDPSDSQERMAKKLAEAGADVIIGCHPHVVQPMKILKTSDGRRVPCYYSLGNFISNMFWSKTQLEGIAELDIVKWNGETRIEDARYVPLINHISKGDDKFTAYLLTDYKGDIYKDHYMNNRYWMGAVTQERMKSLFDSLHSDKWQKG